MGFQVVEVEDAVEVIDLVLKSLGKQALGPDAEDVGITVQASCLDPYGPR